jgi:hypothetical protein
MWSKRLSAAVVGTILIVGAAAVAQQRGGSQPSVVGVWKVSEATVTGPNARKIANPQPGIRIFTQRHYSIIEVQGDTSRPDLPPQGQATDKQLADVWRPFVSNAGTYEVKGNEITTRAVVAKNPGVMRAGSFATVTFQLEGRDTLWLTQKSNDAGPVANPITYKLTRLEQ